MAATPETAVKTKLKRWLKENAIWWTAISDRFHIGLPDFMAILKSDIATGRFTGIECKSHVGSMSGRQLHEARTILAAGGAFYIARPSGSRDNGDKGFVLSEILNGKG